LLRYQNTSRSTPLTDRLSFCHSKQAITMALAPPA